MSGSMRLPAKAALAAAVLMSLGLAGCFGGGPEDVAPPEIEAPPELDEQQQTRFSILAAPEIRDYRLPGSQALEPQVKWFNDTIGTEANTAYQDRNMDGGNDFNTQIKTFDISDMVPEGQPTALRVKLVYFGQAGSSAKADIYVCVPGTCTYFTRANNDQFNWKATVQVKTVMTIGVSGQPAEVGVAYANGLVVNPMDFTLEVQADYFADVLTPHHAYAFQVPEDATGVTLRSVKPGQEHLQAKFIVIDPNDERVSYTEYDDIAIPSESVFIPTPQPGEYIFYAQEMHNGFFSITSDAPLENATRDLRKLETTVTETVDASGPALGVPARAFQNEGELAGDATPWVPGTTIGFTIDPAGPFPLEIGGFVEDGFTGAAEIHITSSSGLVAEYERLARYDTDQGSLGHTRDEMNTWGHWQHLQKGDYIVEVVSDAVTGGIGHWIKTYAR